jgi:TonB family protein
MLIRLSVLTLSLALAAFAHATPATPAKPLSTPAPPYDAAERNAGHAGRVVLAIDIGADGKVADARVAKSSGWPVLDAQAVATAKEWTFEPARDAQGAAIASSGQMPVNFDAGALAVDPAAMAALRRAREMTCADFLADLEARQLVPDKQPEFEAFTNWLLGRHVAMAGAQAALEKTQRMDRLGEDAVRACRKAPKKSFADVVSVRFAKL